MSTSANPDNFRPRHSNVGGQQYLDATIRTASPARLRLMLIERAIEVTATVARVWRDGTAPGSNEHTLRLLELLNELLGGIAGSQSKSEKKVCQQVSDLYVFLAQHLVSAETNSDVDSVEEISLVLQIEAETWRAVCAQEQPAPPIASPSTSSSSGGLNFSV